MKKLLLLITLTLVFVFPSFAISPAREDFSQEILIPEIDIPLSEIPNWEELPEELKIEPEPEIKPEQKLEPKEKEEEKETSIPENPVPLVVSPKTGKASIGKM